MINPTVSARGRTEWRKQQARQGVPKSATWLSEEINKRCSKRSVRHGRSSRITKEYAEMCEMYSSMQHPLFGMSGGWSQSASLIDARGWSWPRSSSPTGWPGRAMNRGAACWRADPRCWDLTGRVRAGIRTDLLLSISARDAGWMLPKARLIVRVLTPVEARQIVAFLLVPRARHRCPGGGRCRRHEGVDLLWLVYQPVPCCMRGRPSSKGPALSCASTL